MKIRILGNGGYINNGLPYNAFVIDGSALVETPPDIMQTLQREKIGLDDIREIYISHLHGDHTFGFPFIALQLFMDAFLAGKKRDITIYSPAHGAEHLCGLLEMALSKAHPSIEWLQNNLRFVTIGEGTPIELAGYRGTLYRMDHSPETYGFILEDAGEKLLGYTADTKWGESAAAMIAARPRAMLVDSSGEPDDAVPVHLGEHEVLEYLAAHADIRTIFYGTHLKYQKEKSGSPRMRYVHPGMTIEA